jgi:prohibitin 1
VERGPVALVVGGVVALVVLIATLSGVVWSIPAGNVGVVSSFGEVSDDTLQPGGPYLVKPWKKVQRLAVQTQKDEEPSTVPTKNGLAVTMNAVLLYHLDPSKAPAMVREVGDKYQDTLIRAYFRNAVRDTCAEFAPEAMYTAERQTVENKVLARVHETLGGRGIVVEAIMLQDPVLPEVVTGRIQAKVAAEQDAQRMEYVLRQKKLEADAKVVEAKGIAEAQKIIQKDLTREYLIYYWIQTLRDHQGATVYIPTGSDGLRTPFFKDLEHLGGKK